MSMKSHVEKRKFDLLQSLNEGTACSLQEIEHQ